MLEFINRIFGRENHSSRNVAKERLRLVLVHDRAGVSPELLQTLRIELIQVISNYMEIDENALEVSLDSNESQVALVANIPVKKMKRTMQTETA
ncbi:cell division topological specificity factor MinE [Desulfoscipio gibsoniae]|uniref:Cell division topological specificity factor n=1 Tax=Desulfoscipio gibsoniae DSM 7213 TaxID=767817 RepID=R4KJ51_9FIRM|nr:cell division topological specificity factor MinE [Desulfoscipio gibsoniae]AGL02644.1 cell division topological specificity factor MinE [Desulfoscipio gibsoniae DSM 7213]